MVSQDFRTIRTTHRIQQALISLLQQTPLDKVTVAQIVKSAKISRRSFYVHYQDKNDLVATIEDQLLLEFSASLAKENTAIKTVTDFTDPQLLANTRQSFAHILRAMAPYRANLAVLLSSNGDQAFYQRFQQVVEEEIATRLKKYGASLRDDIPEEYAMALLVGNLMELITIWLQKKNPESPAKFAAILTKSRMIAPLQLLCFDKTASAD